MDEPTVIPNKSVKDLMKEGGIVFGKDCAATEKSKKVWQRFWLESCRVRLGGNFPVPEIEAEAVEDEAEMSACADLAELANKIYMPKIEAMSSKGAIDNTLFTAAQKLGAFCRSKGPPAAEYVSKA